MRTARSAVSFLVAFAFALTAVGVAPVRAATLSVSVTGPTTQPGHVTQGTQYANEPFLTVSGGTAPYTFTNTSLPKAVGMTVNADGTITGMTCGANGNDSLSFTVTDAAGSTLTSSTSYVVNRAPGSSCALTFPASGAGSPATTARVGASYSSSVVASGGTAPYTYRLDVGSLPPGLTLGADGTLSGTPTTAGTYSFVVAVSDSAGAGGVSGSYTIAVSAAGPTITTATLPVPVITKPYSQTVQASGGTAPLSFSVAAGALPAGLALNASTGAIGGTPTTAGPYGFTITATDANAATASRAYSGTIAAAPAIATASLPVPVLASAYSQAVQTSAGTAPFAFAISTGALPAGLTLNATTGVISGTPTAAGAYGFTVAATDANGLAATHAYGGTIVTSLAIVTASLPAPVMNAAYGQTVQTLGGTAPIGFAVAAGALPAGLTLNAATGAISGTPTASGSYSFTIAATDANAVVASQGYTGAVAASTFAIATSSLPVPLINTAYTQTLQTANGTAPIAFTVSAGALPAGLSLNASTGAVTGTPAAAGAYAFTVSATDAHGASAAQAYSGTIAAALAITTATLPAPVLSAAYAQTVQTSGGTAPFTFAVAGGTLPAGLFLNPATGVISGTLTDSGPYSYTVAVTDANGTVTAVIYSGTVIAALAIATASLPPPHVNQPYQQTVQTTG
ncbi:MAG: beta strand repeat-containing protein, partial [Candidatus Velthaea sp.]